MINYYDLLKPAQKDYYSELLARRLRGSGGGGGVEEIEGVPPLTFQSDGTPLLDYLISGNTVQNGTPTPDSPIQPQECGERTANLFDSDVLLEAVGWEKHDNIYSGYSSALHNKFNSFDKCIPVDAAVANIKVMFKYENLNTALFVVFWYTDGTSTQSSKNGKSGEWTYLSGESDSNKTLKGIAFSYGTNDIVELKEIMLNTGSTALPYEPYGYKIPILSNSTTTNVYLGEVQTTRKIKKLVLTGEEDTWNKSGAASNTFYFTVSDYLRRRINIAICSHYTTQSNINGGAEMQNGNVSFYANSGTSGNYLYVRDSNFATVADFKTYLQQQYDAGTPVTVWYVLATPETATINEPLMKIGDYADSIDKAGAGVNIPTSDGINTLSVNTSVQPSEVYIKYKK